MNTPTGSTIPHDRSTCGDGCTAPDGGYSPVAIFSCGCLCHKPCPTCKVTRRAHSAEDRERCEDMEAHYAGEQEAIRRAARRR